MVNTAQNDINQNQYSLQSYTLIERLKALEVHINNISNLFEDKELKVKLKQKLKQTQPSPSLKSNKGSPRLKQNDTINITEDKHKNDEHELLKSEKSRLEGYLKVYSQRINSLSNVVLSYQTRLKTLQEKIKQPIGMFPRLGTNIRLNTHAKIAEKDEDDDNESFAQYELESDLNSAIPSKRVQGGSDLNITNEIISFKNILIQAQQEELDNLKNEIVKGKSVYVLMTANEKIEWDKYRAIGNSFTLVDKLRACVPPNTKWIDKNVHKVIQSAIELYEHQKSYIPFNLDKNLKQLKSKQEYLNQMINDIQDMDKNKTNNFGKNFMNYYAIILTLLNENSKNSTIMYECNFEAYQQVMNLKIQNANLEDEIDRLQKEMKVKSERIESLNGQINMLKSKNSRIFQENCLLNRFLSSKPGQAKDYISLSNENLTKENEYLKSILHKQVPYNEDLTQSLSFHRIQYHLLKKKFANISLATQNKNIKALETSLGDAQKQLLQ